MGKIKGWSKYNGNSRKYPFYGDTEKWVSVDNKYIFSMYEWSWGSSGIVCFYPNVRINDFKSSKINVYYREVCSTKSERDKVFSIKNERERRKAIKNLNDKTFSKAFKIGVDMMRRAEKNNPRGSM